MYRNITEVGDPYVKISVLLGYFGVVPARLECCTFKEPWKIKFVISF